MAKIRLILADDHAVVRSGIRMLLEAQPDIEIVGDVESGREAIEQTRKLRPDVVLMDVQMPEINGIEATQQIKKLASASRPVPQRKPGKREREQLRQFKQKT